MRFAALFLLLLSQLVPLSLHAEEFQVDAETGFRMERYRAPVPESIPGGTVADTQFVTNAQKSGDIVLIDVYPPRGLGPDPLDGHWVISEKRHSIAGAIWLPEVGRGHLESDAIDFFSRNLERLTSGDKNKGIVFFCTADCWQSWNASKRAIDWGYTNVFWYPEGSDGWQEEGMSVVLTQPVNFFDDTTPSVFPETARIALLDLNNEESVIGTVKFDPQSDNGTKISVDIDSDLFEDQFLSMRPFKCLTGDKNWFCYLPYPYPIHNEVTAEDLTDLEYNLLFIIKPTKEFGIDAWNGVYYKLMLTDDGSIEGKLWQGDLNVLQNPPEEYSRPIDLAEFIDDESHKQRFPALIIKQ